MTEIGNPHDGSGTYPQRLRGMQWCDGDVTTAQGYRAWAIRQREAGWAAVLLVSEAPATFSGLFTTNAAKAAPVMVSQAVNAGGICRAVIINAGNANALTGPDGYRHAERMQARVAQALGMAPNTVAVASTGVIGVPLNMPILETAMDTLTLWCRTGVASDGRGAAEAILTTDTRSKTGAVVVELSTGRVTIGMMAKGSGMIHPNMATMLAFFTTDAAIAKSWLDAITMQAVDRSFHRLTVDGDTSTNDMVGVWANGLSGVRVESQDDREHFLAALTALAQRAAKMIARDGEGAAHLLSARVLGAISEVDAALKARAIVGSSLVKAAVYGGDPNWGRVLAAVGRTGSPFDPETCSLWLGDLCLFQRGRPLPMDEDAARLRLSAEEVLFTVDLGDGSASAEAWGCDLTEGYVDINAHYRS